MHTYLSVNPLEFHATYFSVNMLMNAFMVINMHAINMLMRALSHSHTPPPEADSRRNRDKFFSYV